MAELTDKQLRGFGFAIMVVGLILLFIVRN